MVGDKKPDVVWKRVDRAMLWAGCVRKGHKPVLIRCSRRNLMLYCEPCGVVWGAGMSSLSYIPASEYHTEKLAQK